MSYSKTYLKNKRKYLNILLMNNEIIYYILHFECQSNFFVKDNIYFNNTYCEIIKNNNSSASSALLTNKVTCNKNTIITLFNSFTQGLENKMVNIIKNNTYNFLTKRKHNCDDMIRL
jgi:hypothetical protein